MIKPEEIKQLRSVLGLTQKDLAEKLGTSIKTVANYEGGGVIPAAKQKLLQSLIERTAHNVAVKRDQEIRDIAYSTIVGGNVQGSGNSISNYDPGYNSKADKKEIEHLKAIIAEKERIIEEKERMINLLMKDQ